MIIINDFKYAIRLLSKKPGFTILTTLVMATGIGLSVYLFSFLNTMMFKDLPFKDGGSLVQFCSSISGSRNGDGINLHDYYEIRTNLKGVSEFSAYRNTNVNVVGRDGARRYNAVLAEANIFQLTRTQPILGRGFSELENQQGAEYVVVIGYDLWKNQFGGDANVLDQTQQINGINHRIIGVMPQGYTFPSNAEMWIPLREDATRLIRGEGGNVWGLAHLDQGVSKQDIDSQLAVIMQRLENKYSKTNTGIGAYVETLQKATVGDGIVVIYALHVVAIMLLCLASINVGNLLLSRAVERKKETAIRVALGAPRARLISQMLWESIIICTAGGIIGLLILAWGLEVTEATTKTFFVDNPRFWWKYGIDGYTIKIFILFVVATILVTGLLPAWKNSGADFNSVLRDGTRGSLGKKAGRLNRLLVISEIFISMTVLIAASVSVLACYKIANVNYGANPENILTARVLLSGSKYETPESQGQFARALQSQLENNVDISDVMISSALPGDWSIRPTVAVEGKEYAENGNASYPTANYIVVTPGTLEKLGVELKEGRYFDTSDDGLDKKSVIVTNTFAAAHFPNQSALGKRVRIVEFDGNEPQWLTIVGVVEHTIQGAPNDEGGKAPSIFRPFSQAPRNTITVAMKMKSDRLVVVRTLRKTLESIDPELPAFRIEPYVESIARNTAPMIFMSTIFMLFGVAAVVLAVSGIYGLMSNTIGQRTQEIGIKRALGAMDQRISKEFLMNSLKQLLWGGIPGLLVGCAFGFAASKIVGTSSADLITIAIALTIIIGGAVALAAYIPTRRALKVEVGTALRYE